MTLLPTWLDGGVFALNDRRGELIGIGLYIVLPIAAVGLLSRLAIYFRSRRTGPEPDALSPAAKSAMMGGLSYAISAVLFMVLTVNISSIKSLVLRVLLGIIISAPTLFIMGSMYIIYALQRRRNDVLPSYIVYAACLASIVIQYVYFSQFFSGS